MSLMESRRRSILAKIEERIKTGVLVCAVCAVCAVFAVCANVCQCVLCVPVWDS